MKDKVYPLLAFRVDDAFNAEFQQQIEALGIGSSDLARRAGLNIAADELAKEQEEKWWDLRIILRIARLVKSTMPKKYARILK